ncbi:MAG: Crp/Fnr family transcriptional regulator [Ignavibacteriae bacterium]|nr:Crp/Fnr family transcriptional regulator [Ignavibacteriota bacterium]
MQKKLTTDDLRKIHLFSDLTEEELTKILSFSRHKKAGKGDILFFDTEPYFGFHCVLEGSVKLYKISGEGREHIVHIMCPYSTFGEVPVFESFEDVINDKAVYPINAASIEDDTEVLIVSAKPFLSFMKENTSICFKFLSTLSKRLKVLNNHIEGITLHDIKRRLAKYIFEEFENSKKRKAEIERAKKIKLKSTDSFELPISKYDLAAHLGTIIETLSRTFKKLQDENLIDVSGKKITVLDLKELKKYSQ